MRKALVFLALTGMLGGPAAGAEVTMDGVARSASLMRQIADACPAVFDVDRDLAERYVKAFVMAGERSYGKGAFHRALTREFVRREAEVKADGAGAWCGRQRDLMSKLGDSALFRTK